MNTETQNFESERKILDSGNRRQFETGAVRDSADGRGRCDLLPLDIVAELFDGFERNEDNILDRKTGITLQGILEDINLFIRTGEFMNIYNAICLFIEISEFRTIPMAIMEVSKHYEEGAKKYAERNWEKGISAHCYVDSGVRHLLKWADSWDDEPHDRAFLWNMFGLLWTVRHKPECNDLPYVNNDNPGEFVEIPEPKSY